MATLVERMLATRDVVVELRPAADGRPALAVTLRRPAESRILQLRGTVSEADVCTSAVAWSGFSEAELFGAAVGNPDPLPFDADAWAAWVSDNVDAMALCASRLNDAIQAHLDRRAADRKN